MVSKKKENVSAKSKCKSNVVYTCFTRFLGYNPSLLSICLNASYIKRIINSKNYLFSKKITSNFHSFEKKEKKIFFEVINKGEVQIISPICPDYEYKKIGENIFSFTFNALNTGIGLPGQRILDEIKNIYAFLEKNNINFTHDAFYGDFESFSKMNCKRLKINQELFLEKLSKSVNTLKRKKIFNKVGLFVNDLSNLKDWNFLMNQNRKKINLKFKKDLSFKKKVIEILNARKNLYLNWFPKKTNGFYLNVLLEQGAEYASMTDIILKKFSNPLIIAADHPKMKLFYNFNKPIGLAYLQKVY